MSKDELLNKIAIENYGMYFNQISSMKSRALILEKALSTALEQLKLYGVVASF